MHMVKSPLNYFPTMGVRPLPDVFWTITAFLVEGSLGSVLWRSS